MCAVQQQEAKRSDESYKIDRRWNDELDLIHENRIYLTTFSDPVARFAHCFRQNNNETNQVLSHTTTNYILYPWANNNWSQTLFSFVVGGESTFALVFISSTTETGAYYVKLSRILKSMCLIPYLRYDERNERKRWHWIQILVFSFFINIKHGNISDIGQMEMTKEWIT